MNKTPHVQAPSNPIATLHMAPADPPSVTLSIGGNTTHQNSITQITGQFQRVKMKRGSKQKSKPADDITQEPIPLPSQVVIPVNSQQIIALPTKIKSQHSYWPLTLTEIKKLPSATIKRVGMKFIDNKDPADVCAGIIESIVRHKKSKKLAFKYWDHNIHSSVPKKAKDFEYLNLKYALEECTWSKVQSVALSAAASVLSEQVFLNRGPTRNAIKKAKQRDRHITC
jgi:hypothetical protein